MGRAALLLLAASPSVAWAGSPCGESSTSSADARFTPFEADLHAGLAVAGAGDVDGDGRDDVLVGGAEDGVWLATGEPSGPVPLGGLPSIADWGDAELGASLSAAGDMVGNALPDFAIGGPGASLDEGEESGAVIVVAGPGATGDFIDDPSAIIYGTSYGQRFGSALAGPVDHDDDGKVELVIGAPGDRIVGSDAGAVYLFEGPLNEWMLASEADAVLLAASGGDEAGRSVSAGDVDADGRGDLLVGAPGAASGGAVYVVSGPTSGVASLSDADAVVTAGDGSLGWSVAGGGDVDGDGYEDLLAGAPGREGGEAWLFTGPLEGELHRSDATAVLTGVRSEDRAGWAVAIPGDVDGDGKADLLIGAPHARALSREGGAAYLVLGPVAGEVPLHRADGIYGAALDGAELGVAVAGAGDVDDDGFADLLLGAWDDDSVTADGGGAWLFYGGPCDTAADADRDGWSEPEDCDDADGSVHPEAEEDACNDRDDDCDGETDEGEDDCDTDDPCEGDDCDTGDTDVEDPDTDDSGDTDETEIPIREGCSCERRGTGGTFSILTALPLALLVRRRRPAEAC